MNDAQDNLLLLDAFASQCTRAPSALAVQHDAISLDYRELDRYANSIANQLTAAGVLPGGRVGLCLERSVHAVAAMLACFKAGATFVPLDADYPIERLSFMIDDAAITQLVVSPDFSAVFAHTELLTLTLDDATVDGADASTRQGPSADDLAYIMYTSGSTGKPKGVPISHRALITYCRADAEVYKLTEQDRTLQFSTLSFDIAIEEIFPPLITGGAVVVRPRERSDAAIELSDLVERHDITALHMATGYWHEWVDIMAALDVRVPTSVRLMVVTGEKVSPTHFQRWQSLSDQPTLWANAYGPTETTVTATVFLPAANWQGDSLPIGKPLPGYDAVILDAENQRIDDGSTGELCIGGPALASGYLNRPEQTAKAFITDPTGDGQARLYRTGDLARWLPDGNIEYAGRIDHQLKVGSFRVEPGEIENAINQQTGVLESLVIAHESGGKKRLLAYVAHGDNPLDLAALSTALSRALPDYMVPARYVLLASFAKTLNGKIDRDSLPLAETAQSPRRSDFKPPSTETELALAAIWRETLGVDDIGTEDSFFSLGGDSLMATRTIARMQQTLGTTLSTRDFFFLETVGMMAGQIDGLAVERVVPPPQAAFINTRGRQLYSVLQPARQSQDRQHGILLVPPLGNEQRRIQRPMRSVMQHLSRRGYTLLRFDWHGTANSSGESLDMSSIEPWLENIEDAAAELAKHCDQYDLVALRTGALLASQSHLADNTPRSRIYWEPVFSGVQWLNDLQTLQRGILADTYRFLRARKANRDQPHEFAGLELSKSLYAELAALRLLPLQPDKPDQKTAMILPADSKAPELLPDFVTVTYTSDNNSWNCSRSTTTDMLVNKGAGTLVDLIESPVRSTQIASHWKTHHAA